MKKIRLAGLTLVLPLALLCACSGTTEISLTANWYADTALTDNSTDEGTETLVYKVEFVEPDSSTSDLSVSYSEGTYTTSLHSALYTLPDGSDETVYLYSSTLTIGGVYSLGGESGEPFEDSVQTEVVFRSLKNRLAPVSSKRTVINTTPTSTSPTSLDGAYKTYRYEYETTYDLDLTTATLSYTDLSSEDAEKVTAEISLSEKTNYFDNEEILFMLRGADLSSTLSFRSVNPIAGQVQSLSVSSPSSTTVTLNDATIGGKQDSSEVSAYKVTLAYSGTYSGVSQTLYYAKTGTNNTYHGALLCMEVPVMYSLGTLRYTLKEATFLNK